MYRDSLEGLRKIDYCNEFEGFIIYALFNLRNFNGGSIRCSCRRYENKEFLDPNVVTMYFLQKKVYGEILVLVCKQRTLCSTRDHDRNDSWVNF